MHITQPIQVWTDIDLGVADTVAYLNTIPGVRTWASCQGMDEGPSPYPAYVMLTWTDEAFERLRREFDITVEGDHWGYVHPAVVNKNLIVEVAQKPPTT